MLFHRRRGGQQPAKPADAKARMRIGMPARLIAQPEALAGVDAA